MKKLVLLVFLFLIPLTLVSETQHRFRAFVAVGGKDGDPHITNILESNLKRELRLLGDVDIVELNDEWHFMLYVIFAQNKSTDGGLKIAIAERFDERLPLHTLAGRYPPFRSPPVDRS